VSGVGVSSTSARAAEAGSGAADDGGNAVDAAIAAVLVSLITEPGVCSLGGGAFVTIDPPAAPMVTIDGYAEMPGRGLPSDRLGKGVREVHVAYGGGLDTTVGYGSIATPGALAALGLAASSYGVLPWRRLVEPAYEWARDGFALSRTSRLYLEYCGEGIFGWHRDSREAIHGHDGGLLEEGALVRIPGLAESLLRIGELGVEDFYRGELARAIAEDIEVNKGILTLRDLASYEPIVRPPVRIGMKGWNLGTNPPPAIGGSTLAALLALTAEGPKAGWTEAGVREMVRIQRAVLEFREERLDSAEDIDAETRGLLEPSTLDGLRRKVQSGSTVHTSAVDSSGLACAITASAGYGSGVMPAGTGIWMNNSLGEQELTRRGLHAQAPGTRLPSNMAPTVGRAENGAVLSLGSPGADRITSALYQTIVNFVNVGMPLELAVSHPRIHVERDARVVRASYERGVQTGGLDIPVREFEDLHMYFGGVAAALFSPGEGFVLASDPRRDGGTAVGGSGVAS